MQSAETSSMKWCSSCRSKLNVEKFGKYKTCNRCRARQREVRKRLSDQPIDTNSSSTHSLTALSVVQPIAPYRSPYGPPPPIAKESNIKPDPVATYQSPYGPPPAVKELNSKPQSTNTYRSPYGPPPSSG